LEQELDKMNPIMLTQQKETQVAVKLGTWIKEVTITVLALGKERNALKKENDELQRQLQQQEQKQQEGGGWRLCRRSWRRRRSVTRRRSTL
jgi:hypothetical protein